MSKFLKNIFSTTSRVKKQSKGKEIEEDNGKEFTPPIDTKRKLSMSRSGRMKQNLKMRGKLVDELFGEEKQKGEVKSLEYRVNKIDFYPDSQESDSSEMNNLDHQNTHNLQKRLGNNLENSENQSQVENSKTTSQENVSKHTQKNLDSDDDDDDDLSKFDKDIEQILQYRESNF